MTDELDRLKAALKAGEPAEDQTRKAAALARAMAEYDRIQGSEKAARPTPNRPSAGAGFWTGVAAMLSHLTTRAALAGTASLAVIGLGLVLVVPYGDRMPAIDTTTTAPLATPSAEPVPAAEEAERPVQKTARTAESDAAAAPAAEQALESFALSDESLGAPSGNRLEGAAGALLRERALVAPSLGIVPAPAPMPDHAITAAPGTEAFPEAAPNPLKITADDPVSTFSIDVDTASYAVVRSSLRSGFLPPPEAVRIEEMVNYFPYDWPLPEEGEAPFRPAVSVTETPWNAATRLVTIALQGRPPAIADRPPLNLVFLVDTSGSMQDADKLPLLKQSLRLMLPELRPADQVAIVTYAGSAGRVLDPTPASDREDILRALDRLEAGGATAGQEGLALAYATARQMAADGEVTRVLLATDGDFNVGIADPGELTRYIARERESGTYLSVLGFGRGNLDDATMQALAQNGNGTAAYIDTAAEARKVLVDQLSGALFPIADDVKVQVEWNPATVAEYRLIGYETRALAREDFSNDKVDAGEIGAGHAVTAIYEVTPVGSPRATEQLRYGTAETAASPDRSASFAGELGFLRLRYKLPGESASRLIETPILTDAADGGAEARFAAAIAGFGQLLSDPKHLGDWGWDEAIALATSARGEDPFGYRAEAIALMRLAKALSR